MGPTSRCWTKLSWEIWNYKGLLRSKKGCETFKVIVRKSNASSSLRLASTSAEEVE